MTKSIITRKELGKSALSTLSVGGFPYYSANCRGLQSHLHTRIFSRAYFCRAFLILRSSARICWFMPFVGWVSASASIACGFIPFT